MDPSRPSPQPSAVLEELRTLPLCDQLAQCSPAGLSAMAPLGHIEDHPADGLLFELGEPAADLRFVLSGRVALFLQVPGGEPHVVGTVSRGDLLGWSALRDVGATWTLSARATKPTRCLVFGGRAIRDLCNREREFGYCLMKYAFDSVARRLADARLQLLDVYGARD